MIYSSLNKVMYNNIVITGANSKYFDSLLTLISSIHKDSLDIIDTIVVYDFGLDQIELNRLKTLKNVIVVDTNKNFPVFETLSSTKIKCHFSKMYALYHALTLAKNVLWLDAGTCALRSIKPIFDIIDSEDIFIVGDEHINIAFTHKRCIEIMNATEKEIQDRQISSGIFGFKSNGKYKKIINDGWEYAQIENCIDSIGVDNHRHDQSILSILTSRYNCNTQDIEMFGYWTSGTRDLQKANEQGSVIFVHRRGYHNTDNLININ